MNRRFSLRAFLFVLAAATLSTPVLAIPNFREVAPGLYRGARPGPGGVLELRTLGVATILSLEDDPRAVIDEQRDAAEAGIRHLSLPLSGWKSPDDATVDQALAHLRDPSLRPLFVHCQYGQDRTGVVVGLHRVFEEGWDSSRAFEEMRTFGFSKLQILMKNYFFWKAGQAQGEVQPVLAPRTPAPAR